MDRHLKHAARLVRSRVCTDIVQMLIPIHPGECGVSDWSAIELQGNLENRSDDGFADLALGRFQVDSKGSSTLVIGSHKLEGVKTKLAKPLAVTTKDETGLAVVGLISYKYVFKNRPQTQKMEVSA